MDFVWHFVVHVGDCIPLQQAALNIQAASRLEFSVVSSKECRVRFPLTWDWFGDLRFTI